MEHLCSPNCTVCGVNSRIVDHMLAKQLAYFDGVIAEDDQRRRERIEKSGFRLVRRDHD